MSDYIRAGLAINETGTALGAVPAFCYLIILRDYLLT